MYKSSSLASSKLTIIKKTTKIVASNKIFNVKSKKTIRVSLNTIKNPYDGNKYLKSGKKLKLKINKKIYTSKINKEGVAKFSIKLNKKGKFTAKIIFGGDLTYSASKKTIKIIIK